MLIYESNISIDMVMEDGQYGSYSPTVCDDDLSTQGRNSMETILSSASATQITFALDKLPMSMAMKAGGILERRGRGQLGCDTSAYYDMSGTQVTPTMPASGASKKSFMKPVFGFEVQEITPPVGSPLWNRKWDGRALCTGPLSRGAKWT